MHLLSGTATKTFNLLSIGQRGVGKTVFLAGSYAELHAGSQTDHSRQWWFDSQDSQAQEDMESILRYVAQTGRYPPPTMKITDFHFNLKRRSLWGIQTPCHFRWWDIPGEICDVRNPDFRQIVFVSYGCCVFIDAYALVHTPGYQQELGEIIQQALAVATLVSLNRLEYAFALVLTKCDLLEPRLLGQGYLEERLQPLTTHLEQVRTNYQMFRSNIPLISTEAGSTLRVTGAATPLLWLVCELAKAHRVNLILNPLEFVTHLLPSRLQPQSDPADGSLQRLFSLAEEAPGVQKTPGLYLFRTTRRNLLLLALAIAGLVGIAGFFSVNYERIFQRQPHNQNTLSQAAPSATPASLIRQFSM